VKNQLFIALICFSLASCVISPKKYHYTGTKHNNKGAIRVIQTQQTVQDNSGIIYGNIQTSSRLKNIEINKILFNGKLDAKNKLRVRTFSNGNFIAENLKPGNYIISSIDTRKNTLDIKILEKEVEYFSIQVHPNEVVYAGTYKIISSTDVSIKTKERLMLQRSAYPTEKKILRHVSKIEKNTKWAKSLKARMNKLI